MANPYQAEVQRRMDRAAGAAGRRAKAAGGIKKAGKATVSGAKKAGAATKSGALKARDAAKTGAKKVAKKTRAQVARGNQARDNLSAQRTAEYGRRYR